MSVIVSIFLVHVIKNIFKKRKILLQLGINKMNDNPWEGQCCKNQTKQATVWLGGVK